MFDHFGLLAPFYDKVFKARYSQELFSLLESPAGGSLLDAGGGTGRVSALLKPFFAQVTIVDISPQMLYQVRSKNGLRPVCASSEVLPFADNSFDRTIMIDALHHVENASATMTELLRVTKYGGRIVIEEPDYQTFPVKLLALAEKFLLMRSRFYTPADIVGFLSPSKIKSKVTIARNTAWIVFEKT